MNNELIIESLFFVLSNPLKQSDLKKYLIMEIHHA